MGKRMGKPMGKPFLYGDSTVWESTVCLFWLFWVNSLLRCILRGIGNIRKLFVIVWYCLSTWYSHYCNNTHCCFISHESPLNTILDPLNIPNKISSKNLFFFPICSAFSVSFRTAFSVTRKNVRLKRGQKKQRWYCSGGADPEGGGTDRLCDVEKDTPCYEETVCHLFIMGHFP